MKEGLYHLDIRNHTRSKTRWKSGVHKGAYVTGSKLEDEATGVTYDHSSKGRKENISSFMVLPEGAAEEWKNPKHFFNELENAEVYKGKNAGVKKGLRKDNSRLFKELEISGSKYLSKEQNIEIGKAFAEKLLEKYNTPVLVAYHEKKGYQKHFHIIVSPRILDVEKNEFGKKQRDFESKKYVYNVCELWSEVFNEKVKEFDKEIFIDHRSFEERQLKKIPQKHINYKSKEQKENGVTDKRFEENRDIKVINKTLVINHLLEDKVEKKTRVLEKKSQIRILNQEVVDLFNKGLSDQDKSIKDKKVQQLAMHDRKSNEYRGLRKDLRDYMSASEYEAKFKFSPVYGKEKLYDFEGKHAAETKLAKEELSANQYNNLFNAVSQENPVEFWKKTQESKNSGVDILKYVPESIQTEMLSALEEQRKIDQSKFVEGLNNQIEFNKKVENPTIDVMDQTDDFISARKSFLTVEELERIGYEAPKVNENIKGREKIEELKNLTGTEYEELVQSINEPADKFFEMKEKDRILSDEKSTLYAQIPAETIKQKEEELQFDKVAMDYEDLRPSQRRLVNRLEKDKTLRVEHSFRKESYEGVRDFYNQTHKGISTKSISNSEKIASKKMMAMNLKNEIMQLEQKKPHILDIHKINERRHIVQTMKAKKELRYNLLAESNRLKMENKKMAKEEKKVYKEFRKEQKEYRKIQRQYATNRVMKKVDEIVMNTDLFVQDQKVKYEKMREVKEVLREVSIEDKNTFKEKKEELEQAKIQSKEERIKLILKRKEEIKERAEHQLKLRQNKEMAVSQYAERLKEARANYDEDKLKIEVKELKESDMGLGEDVLKPKFDDEDKEVLKDVSEKYSREEIMETLKEDNRLEKEDKERIQEMVERLQDLSESFKSIENPEMKVVARSYLLQQIEETREQVLQIRQLENQGKENKELYRESVSNTVEKTIDMNDSKEITMDSIKKEKEFDAEIDINTLKDSKVVNISDFNRTERILKHDPDFDEERDLNIFEKDKKDLSM